MCDWRTIYRMDGAAQYSEPFPRGGPSAVFTMDVVAIADAPTFVVTVEHRNSNDTWTVAGTFPNITGQGVSTKDITGLKQLLRFKYSFTSTDENDGVTFRCPRQMVAWRAV